MSQYKIKAFDTNEELLAWVNPRNVTPVSVWCTPVAVYLLYEVIK